MWKGVRIIYCFLFLYTKIIQRENVYQGIREVVAIVKKLKWVFVCFSSNNTFLINILFSIFSKYCDDNESCICRLQVFSCGSCWKVQRTLFDKEENPLKIYPVRIIICGCIIYNCGAAFRANRRMTLDFLKYWVSTWELSSP